MESAFKVKADGWLVKKIIALVWKCARAKGLGGYGRVVGVSERSRHTEGGRGGGVGRREQQ